MLMVSLNSLQCFDTVELQPLENPATAISNSFPGRLLGKLA